MSYALLWVETLIAALLWVALLLALAARISRKWLRVLIRVAAMLVPLLFLGGLTLLTLAAKLSFRQVDWLGYAASLLVLTCIGMVLIARRARRDGPIWPLSTLSGGFLAALVVACMTLWNMDLAVRAQAGMLGVQAGAILVSISPPAPPDPQNAAVLYEKVFARLDADASVREGKSPLTQDAPDLADPQVNELLDRHAPTIALLLAARELPQCRFDHDYVRLGFGLKLPELNQMRVAGRLLNLHIRREAARGHIDAAFSGLAELQEMARHVGQQPFIISAMVAYALDATANQTLQELLPMASQGSLLDRFHPNDPAWARSILRLGMRGEECFGLATLGDLAGARMSLQEVSAAMSPQLANPVNDLSSGPMGALYRVFVLRNDLAIYTHIHESAQQIILKPFFQARDEISRFQVPGSDTDTKNGFATSIMAPNLTHVFSRAARVEALDSQAIVAIAATRYRIDHGALPAKLDELVPAYLEEIPDDPFDGNPLRLAVKPEGWTVYSIGPDGHDDGGAPITGPFDAKSPGDIVFTLKGVKPAATNSSK